jgi:predicted Zn-dependent protease
MLSDEDEMKYGDQIAEEFNKEVTIINYKTDKVRRIGEKMLSYVSRPAIQYKFRVIETDEVNAFAVAGGNIYVTKALLDFVENDDQLAFVIGHEIGHVDLKHSSEMVETIVLAGTFGGSTGEMFAGIAYKILSTPFSKYQEYDADKAGAYLSYKANYEPRASISFFNKLSDYFGEDDTRRTSGTIDNIMRTHPYSKDRATRIKQYINDELK